MGKKLKQILQTYQWPFFGIAIFTSLCLGYIGFENVNSVQDSGNQLSILYRAIQLFTLESGDISGAIPWQLEVARFVSPTLAALAALKALTLIFKEQFSLIRAKILNNHIIICGLGQKGTFLSKSLLEKGYQVVVIEIEEANNMIEKSRGRGAIVLLGDARDDRVLTKARINKAKYIIATCSNDGINAQIAVKVRQSLKETSTKVVTCILHIVDPKLYQLLKMHEIGAGPVDNFRLEFINIFDSGAKTCLEIFQPFEPFNNKFNSKIHLLVVGAGHFSTSLIEHVSIAWQSNQYPNNKKLCITIIDDKAQLLKDSLLIRLPILKNICDITPLNMDITGPEFNRFDFIVDKKNNPNYSRIFICLEDEFMGMSVSLALHSKTRQFNIPIVVQMKQDIGLTSLIKREDGFESGIRDLNIFALLDQTCRPNLILEGTYESLARSIHNEYVKTQMQLGQTSISNPSLVLWEELPDHLKESNRQQADFTGALLRSIGCYVAPLTGIRTKSFEFSAAEIESMSEKEHDRWMQERLSAGWKFTKGEKNIKRKKSPYLVSWKNLTDDIKERDRNTVRALPQFLEKAGLEIIRMNEATYS